MDANVQADSASQAPYDPNAIHYQPQTIQMQRFPGADQLLQCIEIARRVDVNIIDSKQFALEHPFIHLIHSSCNLLSSAQMKSKLIKLLAEKRDLVLQLLKIETRYDSLRSSLCEEEGDDEVHAFCQANYGIDDLLQGDELELALRYMDLTFKPYVFPGLEGTEH